MGEHVVRVPNGAEPAKYLKKALTFDVLVK